MIKIDKEKIKQLNYANFYILADFDNTITSKESKSSMGVITNSKVFDINFKRRVFFESASITFIPVSLDRCFARSSDWLKPLSLFLFLLIGTYTIKSMPLKQFRLSNINFAMCSA